jgi:hypothetical protein
MLWRCLELVGALLMVWVVLLLMGMLIVGGLMMLWDLFH